MTAIVYDTDAIGARLRELEQQAKVGLKIRWPPARCPNCSGSSWIGVGDRIICERCRHEHIPF